MDDRAFHPANTFYIALVKQHQRFFRWDEFCLHCSKLIPGPLPGCLPLQTSALLRRWPPDLGGGRFRIANWLRQNKI